MRTLRLASLLFALALSACSEPVQPGQHQVGPGAARLDIGTYIGTGTAKPDSGSSISGSAEPTTTTRGSGYIGGGH